MDERNIFKQSFLKISDYIDGNSAKNESVGSSKSSCELREIIDLKIPDGGVDEEEFGHLITSYLEHSVRTGHAQFFNQLYSGFNLPAFIGEVFTALTNTSMYTYEVAPVATLIEKEMINLMNQYTGYDQGDGIFTTGGSNGNLIAMFSARNRISPDVKFKGFKSNVKLRAFISEHAHYSFETAANLLGIGSESVIKVKADDQGRMIPEELHYEIKASIARGEKPFFVSATCGTTLLGAYDPIDEIYNITSRYNIWLHADGSFGGSVVLSDSKNDYVSGLEKTDSFVWNPHKLMNIPLVCSAILVKDKNTLYRNFTDINADYLFHNEDLEEDLGRKSIQCGRRVDAVKLWFAWKYYGQDGYRKRINHLLDLSEYAEALVEATPQLELFADRQSFALCFRYIPKDQKYLDEINLKLRDELSLSGLAMVNYGYYMNSLVLRLVITNAELQESDLDHFFKSLSCIAERIEVGVAG